MTNAPAHTSPSPPSRDARPAPRAAEVVVAGLCGFAFAAAPSYLASGDCTATPALLAASVGLWALFLLAFVALRIAFARTVGLPCPSAAARAHRWLFEHPRSQLRLAAVLAACWAPGVLMLFPGDMPNDSCIQLQMGIQTLQGAGGIWAHHPPAITLLLTAVIGGVHALTGSWHAGIFAFVLLQLACTACALGYALRFAARRLRVGRGWSLALLALACLDPVMPVSCASVSKDSVFSFLFVLLVVAFMEIVLTRGGALGRKRFLARFAVLCLLCCLAKNLGVYVVSLSLLAVLAVYRRRAAGALVPLVSCVVVMFALLPGIYAATGATPGGKQEMFSVPFQQTARYAAEHADDTTPDERAKIDALLDYGTLADRYAYDNADPVKGYFERGDARAYLDCLGVWAAQGLRHPGCYVDAFAALHAAWFSTTQYTPTFDSSWHPTIDERFVPESAYGKPDAFEASTERLRAAYDALYEVPVLGLLLSIGLYATVVPALSLACLCARGRRKMLVALAPIGLSIVLGMWLAPLALGVEGARYLEPVVFVTPLVLAWCIHAVRTGTGEETA